MPVFDTNTNFSVTAVQQRPGPQPLQRRVSGEKNSLLQTFIQCKLVVGSPDNLYEKEADMVADKVMRMPEQNFIQRKCVHCQEEEEKKQVQRKPISDSISPFIQTKSDSNAQMSNSLSNKISSSQGSGSSMDAPTESFMSNRFGADFSNVKIHTDSEAIQMNHELNAKAFTIGNDVYFNEGQYQPNSSSGKQLLAHELTHTIQQSNLSKDNTANQAFSLQRTPNASTASTTTQASAAPATDADVRQIVTEAINFLAGSADFYQLAMVNSTTFERTLNSWITMANAYPSLIETRLNNDAALMQAFKQAFNNAVRVLFTRYSAQPNNHTSVINLYLTNLYRLPQWSWPNLASLNLSDETQRRLFVTSYTTALNASTLFQGFSTITIAQLENILSYLFTLTSDTQNMLANNLNNDASLVSGLRSAYSNAINLLLSRAVSSMQSETVFSLFMRYRYQRPNMIHEWADQQLSNITGAVPLGVSPDPITGDISFSFNGYNIIIRADGTQSDDGATTHGDFAHVNIPYQYNTSNNRITSFTAPPTPSVTIWTDYGPSASSGVTSGYGRGTTAEDIRLGNTTLGYHERSHSRDFLSFMANTPPPVFGGTVGMTVTQFSAAVTAYRNALALMARTSEIATDCVGTPNIVQYHRQHHTTTTVVCP